MERVIPFCHPASTFQSVTPKTRGTLDREACQASEEEEEEEEGESRRENKKGLRVYLPSSLML